LAIYGLIPDLWFSRKAGVAAGGGIGFKESLSFGVSAPNSSISIFPHLVSGTHILGLGNT
jgi:hypothetical protein